MIATLGWRLRNQRIYKLFGIALFLTVSSSYIFGTGIEAQDSFCASCHVEPETSYYQASLRQDQPETLAAYHAGIGTRCIDCHSRPGIPGRLRAQLGGLQNFLAFQSGNYRDPSTTTRPVGDGGCSKCHRNLTWVTERPGHYHSPELRREWRSLGGPENTCEVCHPSHDDSLADSGRFIDEAHLEDWCEECHQHIGIGD